jgi:hypothetical protein
VSCFVPFDLLVNITYIEQKWRALATVQVGQVSVLDRSPKFPFTHAEIFGSLSSAQEAGLRRGRETHMHLETNVQLDNIEP